MILTRQIISQGWNREGASQPPLWNYCLRLLRWWSSILQEKQGLPFMVGWRKEKGLVWLLVWLRRQTKVLEELGRQERSQRRQEGRPQTQDREGHPPHYCPLVEAIDLQTIILTFSTLHDASPPTWTSFYLPLSFRLPLVPMNTESLRWEW